MIVQMMGRWSDQEMVTWSRGDGCCRRRRSGIAAITVSPITLTNNFSSGRGSGPAAVLLLPMVPVQFRDKDYNQHDGGYGDNDKLVRASAPELLMQDLT